VLHGHLAASSARSSASVLNPDYLLRRHAAILAVYSAELVGATVEAARYSQLTTVVDDSSASFSSHFDTNEVLIMRELTIAALLASVLIMVPNMVESDQQDDL
jgi:hypothetical protein